MHTETFTPKHFYTQRLLHTQKLLHTEAFTHRHFYTAFSTHRSTFLPHVWAIKPHFVRKGCAGRVQIAILPQFLALEPHFYQNAFEMQRFSKLQLSDRQRERPTGQRDNGNGTTGQRERDNGTGSTEPILGFCSKSNWTTELELAKQIPVWSMPSCTFFKHAVSMYTP